MTTIVCLVRKKGRVEVKVANEVERILRRYAPQYPLEVHTESWIADNGQMAAWRAFPSVRAGQRVAGGPEYADASGCLWLSGHIERSSNEPLSFTDSTRSLEGFGAQFADVGGVYSAFWLDSRLNALVALTNITRIEPVYWAENDECVVVGNRALLVHLAATARARPLYDPSALASFLAAGFYADERVPFAGVRILPPNTALSVVDGKTSQSAVSDVLRAGGLESPGPDTYDGLAEALRGSVRLLRELDAPITASLTGGKDSRLIAAALKAAGVPFRTCITDYGAPGATDVAASREVARRLGVEHEVRSRARPAEGASYQEIDLLRRVRQTLFLTDGMLSGYENVPRPGTYLGGVRLGGHGGELLRGGYAKIAKVATRADVEQHLRRTFGRNNPYLCKGRADEFEGFLATWVQEQPKHLSAPALLDRFYLFYRCGRWSAAGRAGNRAFQDLHQPLFDSRLITRVQRLRIDPRLDDRLNSELLRRLAPELIDVPFANSHWLFASAAQKEADRAVFPEFYQKPGSASGSGVDLDWRTRFATQLREEFRRQILEGPAADALFDVLDRNRLRELFESPDLAGPANRGFLFAVYTLSVLLSNDWLEEPHEGRVVTVDLAAP